MHNFFYSTHFLSDVIYLKKKLFRFLLSRSHIYISDIIQYTNTKYLLYTNTNHAVVIV